MRRDRKERIGNDLSEYQKWVDYDMKKYGRISDITKGKIRKAGLSIVKDQYGDYEVIADRPIKERLNNRRKVNEARNNRALRYYTVNYNGDTCQLIASSEEEAMKICKKRLGKRNNNRPSRTAEELDRIALRLYNKNAESEWYNFTDKELAILWSMCMLTDDNPWGQPYDDEIYDTIASLPNSKNIFQMAEDILDGKVNESCSPRKLKEGRERHIEDLSGDELVALRKEIVLGSLFTRDYENSFDIDKREVEGFFDGFIDWADEEYNERYGERAKDIADIYDEFDNDDDLIEYAKYIEW